MQYLAVLCIGVAVLIIATMLVSTADVTISSTHIHVHVCILNAFTKHLKIIRRNAVTFAAKRLVLILWYMHVQ